MKTVFLNLFTIEVTAMRIAELGTPFAEKPSSHWVFRFDTYRAPRYNRKTIGKARDNGCQSVLFTFSNNPAEFSVLQTN